MLSDTRAPSRFTALLVGAALGDAIGLSCEFLPGPYCKESYPQGLSFAVPWVEDLHRAKFRRGEWTDDTDQALLILFCAMANEEPRDFARRLKMWSEQGLRCLDRLPLGIGNLTGTLTCTAGFEEDPFAVALSFWKRGMRKNAANGSLMRTWIVGGVSALKGEDEESMILSAVDYGRVTHADERCILSTVIVSVLVFRMFQQDTHVEQLHTRPILERYADRFLNYYGDRTEEELTAMRQELYKWSLAEDFASLQLDDARGMGYVYRTLGAALVSLRMLIKGSGDYDSILTELCLCGGDADTNAVVAGALMGCYLGAYALLPDRWLRNFQGAGWLQTKAHQFCVLVGATEGHYSPSDDPDLLLDGGKGFKSIDELEKEILARVKDVLPSPRSASSSYCGIQ